MDYSTNEAPLAGIGSVYINVDRQPSFKIRSAYGNYDVQGKLNRVVLSSRREFMYDYLDKFKRKIKDAMADDCTVNDWCKISEALLYLTENGRALLRQIFGENLHDFVRLFHDIGQSWKPHGWIYSTPPAPLIEVRASLEDMIPLEILPLMDLRDPPDVKDYLTLFEAASRFLGFSTAVNRVIVSVNSEGEIVPMSYSFIDRFLENLGGLPIKFFVNPSLPGVESEHKYFELRKGRLSLDGPWPINNLARKEMLTQLVVHLRDPGLRFDGHRQSTPDQIHHFSCDCHADSSIYENSSIELKHEVRVGEILSQFANPDIVQRSTHTGSRPLVFLNACGSSQIDPRGAGSFAGLFLENGNRGFIGVETAIPDKFAAAFSRAFYSEMLTGKTLGEALYRARWYLLKRHLNPLGILYTNFANPDTSIRYKP